MLTKRELITGICVLLSVDQSKGAYPIDLTHNVTPVKQPSDWSCWAAATTMIYNWKNGLNFGIDDVVKLGGPEFERIYRDSFPPTDRGISATEEAEFYRKISMEVVPGLNPSIEGWGNLLKSKGPLSITVDAKPGTGTIHALVLTGLVGDGTSDGTIVTYIDPADGISYTLMFREFLKLYEGSANWPLQIIHNP